MYQNLVVLVLAGVVGSLAYPQDAEILPSHIPRGSDSGRGNGDGVFIVNVGSRPSNGNPLTSLFDQIFRTSFFPTRVGPPVFSDTPAFLPDIPLFPEVSFGFPSIHDMLPVEFPNLGNLPDNYHNSTHDVTVVNGTRIETNTTVTKSKDGHGVFVQEVHIIRYTPEEEGGKRNTTVSGDVPEDELKPAPEANTSDNEIVKTEKPTADYEDFGIN